jgi:hypothetical protein
LPDWGYFSNPQIPQKFATVPKTFVDMSKTLKHSFNNFLDFPLLAKYNFWPQNIGRMTKILDPKLPITQKH